MARRRMTVAFEEVESPENRMWRQLGGGIVTDDDRAGRKIRLGRFWCAADKPEYPHVARVYRTNVVPEDAVCEHCGIEIRELQELMA